MRSVCIAVLGVALGGVLCAQEPALPARLSLDDALRIAEARNPLIVVAQQGVVASQADVTTASRRLNPNFFFSSEGLSFSQPHPPFFDNQEMKFEVQQTFEPGGRRGLRAEQASYGVAASQASVRDTLRQLRFDVRRAYMSVVLAKADDEVARTTLEEIDKVLALNRARYEQGELSGVELRRLQVERFRFADDAFAAELALRNSRSSLLALLNVPPLDQPFDTVEDLLPTPYPGATATPAQEIAGSAITLALASRPDLTAARRDQQWADAGFRLQRALRNPVFSVGAGLQRDFGANGLVVTFAMPMQLFNSNQGGVARAGAEQQQATARLAAVEARVTLEVQQALNAADVARRRVNYVEGEYLKSAREARDIVLASYRSGAATLIDYLDAQRALREALRTQNRARFDYRVSLFQYEAAVGTPAPAQGKDRP